MSVVVNCKRCGKELRAKDRYAGMPTRCPRCGTINQLPSPAKSAPPKKASPPTRPVAKSKPASSQPTSETCAICAKPIRGKAERFTDVHGTVYHPICYQNQAGDAPEDACRICHKRFQTPKERVKDVVGFYYHRKCYQEELQRQKEAAAGTKPKPSTQSAARATNKPKPPARPRPARKTAPVDDDWDLIADEGELDDGWMRPDPDDLVVNEEAEPSPPPKPAAPAPESPAQSSTDSVARDDQPKEDTARPARPDRPTTRMPAPPPSSPKSQPSTPSVSGLPPAAINRVSSGSRPNEGSAAKPKSSSTKRPLQRAKPIEQRRSPPPAMPDDLELLPDGPRAMPDDLELLPDKPTGMPNDLELLPDEPAALPSGLELLPEEPKDEIVEGLEVLDDAPRSTFPSSVPSLSAPLGGPAPLDPFAAPANVPGSASPFDDPTFAQGEALGPGPRSSDNSIPTWLWGVMGLAIAVVVVMLLASMVTAMFSSGSNDRAVADADRPVAEESDVPDSRQDDTDRQEEPPDPFEEESYEWENEGPQGEGFLPDDQPPQARRPRHVPPPRPQWAQPPSGRADDDWPPREAREGPSGRSTQSDETLLSEWRKFRNQSRNASGGAWAGMVFGLLVGLAIYLGVSALALRFSCNMCGEPRASEFRMVGICICQLVVYVLLALVTSPLNMKVAGVICFPLQCAANIALVRFLLPTTNGRAISIAMCHLVMSVVVAVLLLILVIVLILGLVISAAGR